LINNDTKVKKSETNLFLASAMVKGKEARLFIKAFLSFGE